MAVIAGCSGGSGGDAPALERGGGEHLVPAWEPEVDAVGDPDPAEDPAPPGPDDATGEPPPEESPLPGSVEPAGDQAAPDPPAGGDAPAADAVPAAPVSASITDPRGDVTGSQLERPPAWVDLLGATLTRSTDGWELRVRVAGGQAPDSSGSAQHTMNLAFFADLDGDGTVDAQIWARATRTAAPPRPPAHAATADPPSSTDPMIGGPFGALRSRSGLRQPRVPLASTGAVGEKVTGMDS